MIPFLCAMLVWVPLAAPMQSTSYPQISIQTIVDDVDHRSLSNEIESRTGTLNPVLVEHTAATSGVHPYVEGRFDIENTPGSEVFLPSGADDNSFSADCTGGYFLVGPVGSADFSSTQGTISLWINWHLTAPHGRFWGQHTDFETRWSSNRLTLDWGGDTTLVGLKTDWIPHHWYFIAITWDDSSNYLAIFWGDEETEPVEDASTTSWTGSVVGFHSENDIMSSRARPDYQVDGHIDEFRYYSIRRSPEDLRSDYRVTLSGDEPGLAHYYEFEGDLTDAAGNAELMPTGSSSFSQDVPAGEDGWIADQIEVDVRNVKYLHALNGTFETGNPGTNYDWTGDGAFYAEGWRARRERLLEWGAQRASYIDAGRKYIVIENEGYDLNFPSRYRHYNGTSIYWYQIVDNSRQTDQFEFSMNYLYQRGPIGTNYIGNFEFIFEILNGSSVLWSWSIDPTNITQRGNWYSVSPITIDIPGAPSSFEIRVGLNINTTSSYVEIPETDSDLDGDSANGMFVTLLIDDISLTAAQAPNLENVELSIDIAEISSIPISGTSEVSKILLNYSYWKKAAIPFTFTSNSSVSFEYSARISRMMRYSNSTYSTSFENVGVSYNVDPGQSVSMSLYTYIESYPEASDIGFVIEYPYDWENPRVEDPFGLNITSAAIAETGQVEIPIGFADSVGWWKILLDGPNYADSIQTQVLTPSGLTWNTETIFNSGNRIRCRATVRSGSEIPPDVTDVDINWYDPSGAIWQNEVISYQNGTTVTSQATTLGINNASVGDWMVSLSWSNGSEVAYDSATFELHHRLAVFAHTPNIEIESGDGFTAAIYLYDQDSGFPIMSDADMIGNWSTSEIQFNPNLSKGWWEADFNTTDLGTGDFVIVVSVSLPFYELSGTTINIRVPDSESLFAITFRAGLIGALVVMISVVAIALSRRFYMTAIGNRNLELLALESRVDDAKNLIGLLVIHREIGLPVYSNILKGGFQEALFSSFISAITHFRSEFSMDEPTWTAIPISEVITAVQTKALICAIITVESASSRQKTQIEAFGREVGGLYDHEDDTIRTMVRTPTLNGTFDSIFESYFDGQLMKRYVGVKKSLPKHLNAVSAALDTMDIAHGVTVEAIIKSVSILGYSERRAYNMVFEAVDDGYLIAAEKKLPPPIKTED